MQANEYKVKQATTSCAFEIAIQDFLQFKKFQLLTNIFQYFQTTLPNKCPNQVFFLENGGLRPLEIFELTFYKFLYFNLGYSWVLKLCFDWVRAISLYITIFSYFSPHMGFNKRFNLKPDARTIIFLICTTYYNCKRLKLILT